MGKKFFPRSRFLEFRERLLKTYYKGFDTFRFAHRVIHFSGKPERIEARLDVVIEGHVYGLADTLGNIARLAAVGYLGDALRAFGERLLAARREESSEGRMRVAGKTRAMDRIRTAWPTEYVDSVVRFHNRRSKTLQHNWRRSGCRGKKPFETDTFLPQVAVCVVALLRWLEAGNLLPRSLQAASIAGVDIGGLQAGHWDAVMRLVGWLCQDKENDGDGQN